MPQYLETLNPAQREAVTTLRGPLLIVAGAGSGKTRVLTYRIAHLLENGIAPWNILALTFTNKAAREMKERIANVVGEKVAGQLWMGTFHSIFLRILRIEAETLGYSPTFSVYDTSASQGAIARIIKEMNLSTDDYAPRRIAARISWQRITWCYPPNTSTNRLSQNRIADRKFLERARSMRPTSRHSAGQVPWTLTTSYSR